MVQRPIENLITRQMPALRAIAIGFSVSVLVYIGVAWLVVAVVLREPLMELPLAVPKTSASCCSDTPGLSLLPAPCGRWPVSWGCCFRCSRAM